MDKRQSANNEKKVSVVSFSVVSMGDKDKSPLLDYSDIILMLALKNGITGSQGDSTYLLMDIEVNQDMDCEYILTELIVKSTILEVKSMFDENGSLVGKNDAYPMAPFPTFVTYLENHRVILVENQKGSPSLDGFRSTVKYVLGVYVTKENHARMKQEKEQFPIPSASIVGIPPKGGMMAALKQVKKVLTLTLKFYPLNGDGDIDLSEIMSGISKELRRKIGSDRGSVTHQSPRNISGITEVVETAEGAVKPIVVAKYPGRKGESMIKYSEISGRRRMRVPDGERNAELSNMINQGKEIDSISYTSEESNRICLRNQGKIIKFVREEK